MSLRTRKYYVHFKKIILLASYEVKNWVILKIIFVATLFNFIFFNYVKKNY